MRFLRRDVMKTALYGLGALAVPGMGAQHALAQALAGATGFTHGLASGEPAADSLLLWTRYVPSGGGEAHVRVELAETPDFARVVGGGTTLTGPWRDHTAKITVAGLLPARRYFYRFIAGDGTVSATGSSKTLPADGMAKWQAAVFSCANFGFGWFNAYAHAAARGDIDCAIHLGDYFYEYGPDHYPLNKDAVYSRLPLPLAELVHLADYRLRFATYRLDPDLQALHAAVPMIAQWDDHERANDSWAGGAENHHAETQGDWAARRDAAMQAYYEWMPVSEEPWKAYEIGALATLFRTETRLLGRTKQPDVRPLFAAANPVAALTAFRDGPWMDPAASMMGSAQEHWLDGAMAASVRAGKPWQVVGFGTIMGQTIMPAQAASFIDPGNARAAGYIGLGAKAGQLGLPFNYDNWGGYPAARARFLRSAQRLGGNTVVLSGDSHNGWAFNLAQDGKPAAVEFAGHSVTSPGFETSFKVDPAVAARALVGANPEMAWCDTSHRGYMLLTLEANAVTNQWLAMDTIATRTPRASVMHRASVARGALKMA